MLMLASVTVEQLSGLQVTYPCQSTGVLRSSAANGLNARHTDYTLFRRRLDSGIARTVAELFVLAVLQQVGVYAAMLRYICTHGYAIQE